jgi:hypothetical protein
VIDMYELDRAATISGRARRLVRFVVPLAVRLRLLAIAELGAGLIRRGPAIAWEIYQLQTRPEWLDHRVTDRFFSHRELVRCCDELFPGYRFDVLGGPRGIGLVWDAPPSLCEAGVQDRPVGQPDDSDSPGTSS